jgi:zinc transporter 7
MVSSTAVIAALLSTGLISLVPNLILLAFPNYAVGEGSSSPFLTLGQALAAGGLLGDVFLHTLPSASGGVESVELMVLLGFTIFLMVDMLIRSLGGGHSHSHTDEADDEKKHNGHTHQGKPRKSVVVLNLVADALHNFTDGLAIGASFALSNTQEDMSVTSLLLSRGGLATLSIMCHEVSEAWGHSPHTYGSPYRRYSLSHMIYFPFE